ncbi:inverse autotransporter beta domain-containing protein, partial [Pseudomonas sp. LPH60]|uniref:inverse autotransporter beta domain-containing protein n=1 Tax=Pseudomonas sp. LPH60 TaxID=3065906 RepID=UPI00273ACA1B
MIGSTPKQWCVKPHSLFKKLFITYLAVITGCTNTAEQISHSPALNSSTAVASQQQLSSIPDSSDAVNKYNLPELGGASKKDPPSREKPLLNEFAGDMPLSARQDIAHPTNKGFQGADALQGMAAGMLTSASSEEVKKWFSARHATAELSLSTGEKGIRLGSFDLLMPIYDTEKDLIFTQVGIRRSNSMTEDYRTTVNAGVGYRHTLKEWLAGVNAFYDRDITGKNSRFGLGLEAFTDNLKTSANIYVRASDWHKSVDLEDYLERPANGYDVRVEANLPSYPQLGGKLVYEKYFGDQVGLFGTSDRQKDPQALTVGASYNPVPMIGFGVDYRQGQGGVSQTTGKLTINYQFGVPLSKQLSLDYIKSHKLENSRYDLVNRNYEVVLDYREKDAGQVMLPAQINGTPTQVISFPVTFTDPGIGHFSWTGTAAPFAAPYGGGASASLTLPAYVEGGNNNYTLQAVGSDRFGRVIQSNLMQVRVNAFLIALERSQAVANANGTDAVTFTATLQEPTGAPKANTTVTWDVQGNATVVEKDEKTDGSGHARLKLTSRFASAIRVSVQEPQGAKAENDADFSGDQRTAKVITLVASPSTLTANGISTSTIKATIADAHGNSVGPGAPVTWQTSDGTISSTSTVTSDDSTSTITLTSGTSVSVANISATAVAGGKSTSVAFTADQGTARVLDLVATPATITANGSDTSSLVATVQDAHGNAVGAGATVNWTTSSGTLSASSSTT